MIEDPADRADRRRNVPRTTISRAVAVVSWLQCSIESTPASTAARMPFAPIACAATDRFRSCASRTPASSSSAVNALKVAGMPGVRTPPVAISLIAAAPARISSRTAARTASGPSTSRENAMLWPWPPVTVRARPAARIRGPGTRPAATALATSMLAPPIPPRSRTVVTPASRFRFALTTALTAAKPGVVSSLDSFSKSAMPSNWRWTCTSIRPGSSVLPAPATSRAAPASLGALACAPTQSIPSVPKKHALACLHGSPVEDRDVRDVVGFAGIGSSGIMPCG